MGLEDDLKLCGHLPELLSLSRSFSCSVCYELLKGPVVLPCGHSYCSGCIRQNFDFKTSQNQSTVCPSCRTPCDPNDLRASLTLREAVNAFSKLPAAVARQLEAAKQLGQQPCRQEAEACTEESSQPENHSLPQQRQSRKRRAVEAPGGGHHQPASKHATTTRRSGRVATAAAAAARAVAAASPHAGHGNRSAAAAADAKPAPSFRGTSSSSVEILSSSVSQSDAGDSSSGGSGDAESSDSGGRGRGRGRGRADWGSERSGAAVHKDVRSKGNAKAPTQAKRAAASSQHGPGPGRGPGPGPSRAPLPPGYVSCPVCGISTRSALLNAHLDSCIARQQQQQDEQQQQQQQQQWPSGARASSALDAGGSGPSPSAPAGPAARWPTGQQQQRAAQRCAPAAPAPATAPMFLNSQRAPAAPKAPVIEVPPKLVFNLINDKDLKKRLMALGLPVDGKKQEWVDRYQAYRRFLQSKMDEGTRCSQAQLRAGFLLQQRQQTEARRQVPRLDAGAGAGTSYGAAPSSSRAQGAPATATGTGYHYAELIEQARARMEARSSGSAPVPALGGAGRPEAGEQPGDPGGPPGEDPEQREADGGQDERQEPGGGEDEQQLTQQAGDCEAPGAGVGHVGAEGRAACMESRPAAGPQAERVGGGEQLVHQEQPDWGGAALDGEAWDEESMGGSGDFICE